MVFGCLGLPIAKKAIENHHFLIGSTSSNGCFFHCHVSFPSSNGAIFSTFSVKVVTSSLKNPSENGTSIQPYLKEGPFFYPPFRMPMFMAI